MIATDGMLILTEFVPIFVTESVFAVEVTAISVRGTFILKECGARVVIVTAPEVVNVVDGRVTAFVVLPMDKVLPFMETVGVISTVLPPLMLKVLGDKRLNVGLEETV